MAEATSKYPQIPATVWWRIRDILKNKPTVKLTFATIASELSVQESAAKVYYNQLKLLNLLDDDGKPTELANLWRLDDSYEVAKEKILAAVYPEELVTLHPMNDAEKGKVKNWFERQGLGSGSAGNRAATYVLIANSDPNQTLSAPTQKSTSPEPKVKKVKKPKEKEKSESQKQKADIPLTPNLNVNLQIHISADATNDQIESLFSAMTKYLKQ